MLLIYVDALCNLNIIFLYLYQGIFALKFNMNFSHLIKIHSESCNKIFKINLGIISYFNA